MDVGDGGPEFAEVFVIIWIGSIIITLNSKLLGGTMYVVFLTINNILLLFGFHSPHLFFTDHFSRVFVCLVIVYYP